MRRLPKPLVTCAVAGLVLAAAGVAQAQPAQITAEVDRTRVSLHEEVELSIRIQGSADQFAPPVDLKKGFKVVNEGFSRIISGRENATVRTYRLRPRAGGEVVIGPARLLLNGKVVAQSQPITIRVEEPKAPTRVSWKEAQDLERHAQEALFIRYRATAPTYYVGEPFPLALQVFYSPQDQLVAPDVLKAPKLDGLLVEDLPDDGAQSRPQRARVGSKVMNYLALSQQLATPLRPGRIEIDSTTMQVGVRRGMFSGDRRYTAMSEPFTLEIKPLPEAGRPDTFEPGNIGSFSVKAELRDAAGRVPRQTKTGERLILRVDIEGSGNLVSVKPPVVRGDDHIQVSPLPGASDDLIMKDERGMHGRRTFQFFVTALTPGPRKSPDVVFSFFDTRRNKYQTRTVPGAALEVTGDAVSGGSEAATLSGEDVRPLIASASLQQGPATRPAQSALFWAILALPLLGLLVVEARHRVRILRARDPEGLRSRKAQEQARTRLREAEKALAGGDVVQFYGDIARALNVYLQDRAGIAATGMTHDEVRRAMAATGYPQDLVDGVIVEMENCDFARFAPSGSAGERMRETLDRAGGLVKALDKVAPARRPS